MKWHARRPANNQFAIMRTDSQGTVFTEGAELIYCEALEYEVDDLACLLILQQVITSIQNSRPSLPSRQKNTKKKNPWNPLKMTNRYWNAVEASLTVRAPKSHVRPNITIIPTMLIIVFIVDLIDLFFFLAWITNTRVTRIKITTLKMITAKMGARKVTKNTVGSLMKHL